MTKVRAAAIALVAVLVLAACGSAAPSTSVPWTRSTGQRQDMTVDGRLTFSGQANGTVTVVDGGVLMLYGRVNRDLVVEAGGRAEVYGMVIGTVVNNGGDVTIYGWVGRVEDHGGDTVVAPGAVVRSSPVP